MNEADIRADERDRACKAVCKHCQDGLPFEPYAGFFFHSPTTSARDVPCEASAIRALPVLLPRTCAGCRWFSEHARGEVALSIDGDCKAPNPHLPGNGTVMWVHRDFFCAMWEARPTEGETP